MKNYLLVTCLVISGMAHLYGQEISLPPSGDNQKTSITQHIGSIVKVTVNYSSPDVNGRTGKIWGELVPFGLTDQGFGLREPAPWRAGANENTTISFSHDVMVEGKPLAAGKYGLHLIAEQSGPWTWIFSKNNSAWGSYFYTAAEDALRVQVQPKENNFTEWLNYTFTGRQPDKAVLELQWENKAIPMQISVPNINDLYIAQIDKELQSYPGFDPDNYAIAANFLLNENYKLEKALAWSDLSIHPAIGRRSFNTMATRANVLLKMGKKEEATAAFNDAILMSDASPNIVHQLGRTLIGQGEKEMALKVFQQNYDKYKAAWPTNVGMTRGLAAVGRYDEALKYAQAAFAEAPDDVNKKSLENMILRLKSKQDVN